MHALIKQRTRTRRNQRASATLQPKCNKQETNGRRPSTH